jgi:elongation factor Ts
LLDQDFIKDDNSTVAKYVASYGAVEVIGFKRVTLG